MIRHLRLLSAILACGSLATSYEAAAQSPTTYAFAQPEAKTPIVYSWHSGYSGNNRLLFEEPKLERQGISRVPPVQLAQSSAAFFSRSLLLPFNFALGRHRQPENR